MKNLTLISILLVMLTLSCKTKQASEQTQKPVFELVKLWETDTVFHTPESVCYHPGENMLYVSNINSTAVEGEANGFISLMNTDGILLQLKWVSGLKAPKGMGIYGNIMYVADLDELVMINIPEATITNRIKVEGASFLNDVAVDKNGKVYFSDSNTGKIHIYENGTVTDWITEGLKRPNGLFIEDDRILLLSSESQDMKIIDPKTGKFEVVLTGIGRGDGIEYSGYEGYYIASDWQGEIFLIHPDFTKESLLRTQEAKINTADIGLNPDEQIVYVPTFFDNRVLAFKLDKN